AGGVCRGCGGAGAGRSSPTGHMLDPVTDSDADRAPTAAPDGAADRPGHAGGPLTTAVHVGNEIDEGTGAVRTPLVLANSYALPYDPSQMSWSNTEVPFYTRNSGVNQLALQRKLAALEGAEDAVVLASGVAA